MSIARCFANAALCAFLLAPADALAHGLGHQRPELAWGRSADYDYDPPAPGSYRLPPIKPAADGRALNEIGRSVNLRPLLTGKITLLSFIYTRCSDPQGCPVALSLFYTLYDLSAEDERLKKNLQLITMSFDPEHDTPPVMREMGREAASYGAPGAAWHFLTTSGQAALRPILRAYDQPVGLKADANDSFGPLTHQLRVYLIDREARIRNIYSLGFLDPRLVATDVRTLLEERGTAHGH